MNWGTNCSYLNGNGVTTVCHMKYVFKNFWSKVAFNGNCTNIKLWWLRGYQGREHFHVPNLVENVPNDDDEVVTEFVNKGLCSLHNSDLSVSILNAVLKQT